MKKIYVKKRSGAKEELDLEKIHKVLFWACDGISDVSVSDIEMHAHLQFVDGVTSKDIHNILIRSASDLISEVYPNYQYVASKLLMLALRKDVNGKTQELPHLKDVIAKGIKLGVYDKDIAGMYTAEEVDLLNAYIRHERDYNLPYAGARQVIDKYLVQDRKTGEIFETPQIAYMLISMIGFQAYSKIYNPSVRLQYVKKFYDAVSKFKLSLPTPVIAGVRTTTKQYASCVGIDIGDNLNSIFSSVHALGLLTAQRAGMGVNFGRVRSKGSKIRGGEVLSTGLLPYMKIVADAVKSCSQNGIRGGSATCYLPCWHPEIADILVLKNNKGTEENRIRTMDYGFQVWKGFWDRIAKNEDIFLFDPHDSIHLVEAWGSPEFESLYVAECAKEDKVRGKINARELAQLFAVERFGTGRVYYMDMDNANSHSSFLDLVRFSNLCSEIDLPSDPIEYVNGDIGEIFTCILAAINVADTKFDEIPEITDLAVRFLDELIDHMEYVVPAAGRFSKERRALGVGIIGLADLLAREKTKYSSSVAPYVVHPYAEEMAMGLTRASIELAKVKGPCAKYDRTKYSQGILPIDTYNRNVDKVCDAAPNVGWGQIRKDMAEFGMRNSSLMAFMPAESSAVVSGTSNGVEALRSLITTKMSKKGPIKSVAKYIAKHAKHYQLTWDADYTNKGYLDIMSVWQKFADQGMSLNLYSDPRRYEDGLVSIQDIIADIWYASHLGHKQLYYQNTLDLSGEEEMEIDGVVKIIAVENTNLATGCESGACAI